MAHDIQASSEVRLTYSGNIKEISDFFERCINEKAQAEVTIDACGKRLTQTVRLNGYSLKGRPTPSEVSVDVHGEYKVTVSTTPPHVAEPYTTSNNPESFWAFTSEAYAGASEGFVYSWENYFPSTKAVFVVTHRGDNAFMGVYGTRKDAEDSMVARPYVRSHYRISEHTVTIK